MITSNELEAYFDKTDPLYTNRVALARTLEKIAVGFFSHCKSVLSFNQADNNAQIIYDSFKTFQVNEPGSYTIRDLYHSFAFLLAEDTGNYIANENLLSANANRLEIELGKLYTLTHDVLTHDIDQQLNIRLGISFLRALEAAASLEMNVA